MSFLNPSPQAFGLDINDFSLKLVKLVKLGKKIELKSYNLITIPPGVVSNGEIKDPLVFITSLQKLIKTRHGGGSLGREVITVLPETKTFLKNIIIDKPDNNEDLEPKIIKEIEKNLPYNLLEVYLDWQIFNQPNENKTNILVGAAPQKVVNEYLAVLQQAGLAPLALEIEAVALGRSLINPKQDLTDTASIIIDLGATRSGLVIYNQGIPQTTISLPIAGNQITQKIIDTLQLNWEQAEKAKIICGLNKAKCSGALNEILDQTFTDLAEKINQAVEFYYDHFTNPNKIKEILICGGGANFSEIDEVLTQKTGITTKIGNPWINLANNQKTPLPNDQALIFTSAIGLALRGLDSENI
ncbi:MAG: type IV pilus assembly protein PilM [Candidatus Buchananbacteria bacterium]